MDFFLENDTRKLFKIWIVIIFVTEFIFVQFFKQNRKISAKDDDVWDIYFTSPFEGDETRNCQNCPISPGKGQYYLEECNFYNYNNRIINFNRITNTFFLHNQCSFTNCISEQNGNCIYYTSNRSSSIVQRKFCCTKCECSDQGQFSYIELKKKTKTLLLKAPFSIQEI